MLSLALIVKNEEKNLARCLDSVKGLWDELVIVDTGSTDKTVEIARRYTDKIYNFAWVKHFAKARNFAFSKCNHSWVMWLDADDILKPQDVEKIRSEFLKLKDSEQLDYILINYHYWVDPPTSEGLPKATQLRERIIKKSKAKWQGRCHEHILIDWNRSYAIPDAAVWHMRDEEDRRVDNKRNLELMILEVEESPSQRNHFYLGNEYVGVGNHKKAVDCYLRAYKQPENVDTTFQVAYKLGQSYQELGNKEESIKWYLTAIQHDPSYREPLLGIVDIYLGQKEYKKAAYWAESCLTIAEPKNPVMVILKGNYSWVPYNYLAQAYFQLKEYKKSIEASEKLYEITRQAGILNDIKITKEKIKETYKRPTETTRLNLGSGGKTIPGYINCDLFPQPGVDEIFSLDEIPYADHSVDEISSEHALEHLPRPQAERAIIEWARVLKRGGKLLLKVPDLEECCRQFLAQPQHQDSWYMHTLYGIQDFRDVKTAPFPEKVNYGQIHYTGFTEKRLRQLLMGAGFIIDKIYKYDGWDTPSLAVEAHIPNIQNSKRIAFINNTLIPKYLSYGDYWEDAFRASGHQLDVYRYENINSLPAGYDLYFFIEAGGRYDVSKLPDHAHPRVLYSQENPLPAELQSFDLIATPLVEKLAQWSSIANVIVLPNNNHGKQIETLLSFDYKNIVKVSVKNEVSTEDKVVDIIIPSYKSLLYLRECINSIKKNTTNYNLIVVNSGDDQEVRNYLKSESGIILEDSEQRLSFSQAVNRGIKLSKNDVVILNNDTLVGKNWLDGLKNSPFDITNPFSNCDIGWIHNYKPMIGGIEMRPNLTLGDVDKESLLNYESPLTHLINRDQPNQNWVAFYATYIKRKVLETTGFLDETFVNGSEDYDYCRRAVKLGFSCGHVMSSWVFHFGGKTRKISENENYQQHHKEDDFNNYQMSLKSRPTVAIYTGPAWEKWDYRNINTTGIGGSETCAAMLALHLSKLGYRSIIIGDCEKINLEGVEYIPWQQFEEFKSVNYIDYFISSRTTLPLSNKIRNGKNLVWVHDIWLSPNRELPNLEYADKLVCLSPWHADFLSQHHNISKNKIIIQDNGFNSGLYKNGLVEKDPYRLIYSSSPDRGLDLLLTMFGHWKKKFPQLSLHVYYGFDNWKKAIQQRGNQKEVQAMTNILELMKQDGVVYHGRIPQNQLAIEQLKSSLWVYPTNFTETFCITALEAMAAGAVPITTNVAALQTTIPSDCGIKVSTFNECIDTVAQLLTDPKLQDSYRKQGKEYIRKFDWSEIAKQWVKVFEALK